MKKIVITLSAIFISLYLYSQSVGNLGTNFITNFSALDYRANNQNWAVTQDARGVMYFGNTNGVLEFDGYQWNIISTETTSIVRTLERDDNSTIYVGGNATFGYLAVNTKGEVFYKQLSDKIPQEYRNFSDVRKLCITTHGVYFFTKDIIYQYINDTINIINFTAASLFAWTVNDVVFTIKNNGGVYALQNGKTSLLKGTENITDNSGRIIIMPHEEQNILIVTENKGCFLYNIADFYNNKQHNYNFDDPNITPKFDKFETDIDQYITENKIYSGKKLNQNTYGIGTIYGGLLLFDKTGKITNIFNKNRGLKDEAVMDFFLDRDNNIWLAQQQGIAYIHYNNPLTKFDENNGIDGSVYVAIKYKDYIFVGTSLGLFFIENHKLKMKNDNTDIKHVTGTIERIWDMTIIDSNLFVASSTAAYLADDTTMYDKFDFKALDYKDCFAVHQSPLFPNKIFLGVSEKIALFNYYNYKGRLKLDSFRIFNDVKASIRTILTHENDIWFTSAYTGVYRITFNNKNITDYAINHYDTLDGLPKTSYNYVNTFEDKFFIATSKGEFIVEGDKLLKTKLFGYDFDTLGINSVFKIKDKIWVLTSSSLIGYLDTENNNLVYKRDGLYKIMGYSIYNTFVDNQNILWLCTNKGLFRYDTNIKMQLNNPYKTLIRNVRIGKDSTIFNGYFIIKDIDKNDKNNYYTCEQPENQIPIIDYQYNSIIFNFISTFYEDPANNLYSYKLQGFDEQWSHWTELNFKEYTYLTEGEYTFYLKSKNIYEQESEITEFSFVVKPPWYRTILAYIFYVILSIAIIILIVFLNSRRLKAINIRLEKIIKERTAEISLKNQRLEQQKEEIMAQSEQLEITNRELEKLSIVARETDNSVIIMDSTGNLEWANEGFVRLYGYTLYEFMQAFGNNILAASTNSTVTEAVEYCIKNKKTVIYESEFTTKEGNTLWLQTTLTPIANKLDQIVKIIAVESDIRKLKEYEIEILQKNEEINTQKDELEIKTKLLQEHNENIKASIRYAQTIQSAILPLQKNIDEVFDNFIIYRPKDIVSGDFYWFNHYPKNNFNNETSLFAAVDCTGHGVPGAFMSMIASRLINEIVNERKITEPHKILTQLQEDISIALKQEQTDNQDGMDVCFCKIEKIEQQNYNIYFTGAKRPLFYLSQQDKLIHELKADRKSIGGIKINIGKEFTMQTLTLNLPCKL